MCLFPVIRNLVLKSITRTKLLSSHVLCDLLRWTIMDPSVSFFFLLNVRVKIPYSLMFIYSNNFPVQFNPFAMLDLLVWCIYSFHHTMLVLFQFSEILSCAKYNQWEYQPSLRRELSGLNSARRVKYTRCRSLVIVESTSKKH